jgi:hypothetical protein
LVDAIALVVEALIDAVTLVIETLLDTIAALVQALLNPVANIRNSGSAQHQRCSYSKKRVS